MLLHRLLAFVTLLTLLVIVLIVWVYPTSTDLAPSNPGWNGLRTAAQAFGWTGISSLNLLPSQAQGTALIVIPYVRPTADEVGALKHYMEGGGLLIVLDDLGFGNEVLAGLGARPRFSGQLLADPLFHVKNRLFPKILDISAPLAAAGIETLVLNHATVIEQTRGMTVLATSSRVSFLDANGNGQRDAGEGSGPFPVVALGRVGMGSLVLISDPSLLLNSMLDLGQNRKLLPAVIKIAGGGQHVYLDMAHLPRARLDAAKDWLARARDVLALPLTAFAAAAAALVVPIVLLVRPPGGSV